MNVKERVIEQELVNRVKEKGGMAPKVTVAGRRGFVDRLVILPGPRIVFAECKKPRGGRVSKNQISWHRDLKGLGVEVRLILTHNDINRLLTGM